MAALAVQATGSIKPTAQAIRTTLWQQAQIGLLLGGALSGIQHHGPIMCCPMHGRPVACTNVKQCSAFVKQPCGAPDCQPDVTGTPDTQYTSYQFHAHL